MGLGHLQRNFLPAQSVTGGCDIWDTLGAAQPQEQFCKSQTSWEGLYSSPGCSGGTS